ncbi:RNA polymerase-binding protein DksA [Catenulispora sp. GAS73]
MTAVTTSRTKASEAATGATHGATVSSKGAVSTKGGVTKAAAGKAVPKPTRAATGAKASPPTRRPGAGEARRSATGPTASVSAKNTAQNTAQSTAEATTKTATKPSTTTTSAEVPADKETPMTVTQITEAVAGVGGLPPYRTGEDPWTPDEVGELQAELEGDAARLRREISTAETGIADLLRDSGEGAGDDQADAGTKNFEREHEMAIANNAREMLQQTERALARLAAGTYGVCESCGEPVGKYRLQAFPRATLCMSCKQKQERR